MLDLAVIDAGEVEALQHEVLLEDPGAASLVEPGNLLVGPLLPVEQVCELSSEAAGPVRVGRTSFLQAVLVGSLKVEACGDGPRRSQAIKRQRL